MQATGAEVTGLSVGSHTLEFRPLVAPAEALDDKRKVRIVADSSAASAMLIFQAVFPYLLFAGNKHGAPIELEIQGGTNVAFAPSFEFLDQVFLPTLQDRFGIVVDRRLQRRSFSQGPSQRGSVRFRIHPVECGAPLQLQKPWDRRTMAAEDFDVDAIDVSIVVPAALHAPLQEALARDLDALFPGTDVHFRVVEDSGHDSRMYAMLVARSAAGLRWSRDYLYDQKYKNKSPATLSGEISRHVSEALFEELALRGAVDEHLQDQLVIFQALAHGRTTFYRGAEPADSVVTDSEGLGADPATATARGDDDDDIDAALAKLTLEKRFRRDKTEKPFGEGSTHTNTARWVCGALLPQAKWYNKGSIVEGAGVAFPLAG